MDDAERQVARGHVARFSPLPTGFDPLDDVLNGGLRPGELVVMGGPFGTGKTIFGLQVARSALCLDEGNAAIYVSYEHDRIHMMSRLMCLESAEQSHGSFALTMRELAKLMLDAENGSGFISKLRGVPRYGPVIEAMDAYADRLTLVKASGAYSTLEQIGEWVEDALATGPQRTLLVVDYLQKIPVHRDTLQPETETTTYLTQGLKELAMSTGIRVLAIAAADRLGLKAKRMRLSDLRGSSALQYEADVGLILNNKYEIVSREHLVHNLARAENMRNWVILTVEKNRAGRSAVDLEYQLDAAHFRIVPTGRVVRERLVDEKLVLA
jgi:replicative DNA helicase